jgi:hypothetical protein
VLAVTSFSDLSTSKQLLRIAGVLVGASFVVTGIALVLYPNKSSNWWRNYAAPLGIIGTGIVMLMYGFTGRSTLIGRT